MVCGVCPGVCAQERWRGVWCMVCGLCLWSVASGSVVLWTVDWQREMKRGKSQGGCGSRVFTGEVGWVRGCHCDGAWRCK